jgi:hypothetical protein
VCWQLRRDGVVIWLFSPRLPVTTSTASLRNTMSPLGRYFTTRFVNQARFVAGRYIWTSFIFIAWAAHAQKRVRSSWNSLDSIKKNPGLTCNLENECWYRGNLTSGWLRFRAWLMIGSCIWKDTNKSKRARNGCREEEESHPGKTLKG